MLRQLKSAVIRAQDTLCADAFGVVVLMAALVIGLHLPGLV